MKSFRILFVFLLVFLSAFVSAQISFASVELNAVGVLDFSLLVNGSANSVITPDLLHQSITLLEELIKENPKNASYYINLAHNYNLLKEHEKALTLLERAQKIDPENPRTFAEIGKTFDLMRLSEDSIQAYEKMVELDFLNNDNHIQLAKIYLKKQLFEAARKEFEKALEINPISMEAFYALGLVHLYEKHPAKALKCFEKVIALDPTVYQAYNNIGVLYQIDNKNVEAVRCFQQALGVNPDYEIGNFNCGRALLKKGDFSAAEEKLAKALTLNPERERTHYLLGVTYQYLNKIDLSIHEFSYLAANWPENKTYQLILARLFVRVKQYDDAERTYASLIESGVADTRIFMAYGNLLAKRSDFDQAIIAYKKSLALNPSSNKAHYLLSKIYVRQFKFKEALSEFLKSGTYIHSSVTIFILVVLFLAVVILALKIFFHHTS